MDMRKLRYFVAIAEAGSFSHAARRLGVAQPALSQHVLAMEAELGVTLFQRGARGVKPTEAGMRLLDEARAIHARFLTLPDLVRGRDLRPSGEVRFGMPGTVSEQLGVPLIAAVRAAFPDIRLRISEAMSGFVHDWLREGRVGIALLFDVADARGLTRHEALSEEIVLFTRDGTPGAPSAASLPLEGALRLPLVVPSPAHGLRTLIDAAALSIGAEVDPAVEIDSYRQIKEVVAQGGVFGLLPLVAVNNGSFRLWRLTGPALRRRVVLAYSDQRPPSSATWEVAEIAWAILHDRVRSGTWPAIWSNTGTLSAAWTR